MDKWIRKDRQGARQDRYAKCIKEGVVGKQRWTQFFKRTKFLKTNETFREKGCRSEKTNDGRPKQIVNRI